MRLPARAATSRAAAAVLAAGLLPSAGAVAAQPAAPADSPVVALTWLSITNWLLEAGDTRILLDGYLTRIDRRLVEADGTSNGTAVTDTAQLRRLLAPAVPDLRLDWILVGHGHWDHAFDVPAIARMTGARIVGPVTVCRQAVALGVHPGRCTPVEGGEVLPLSAAVHVRVVRWDHSGDPATEAGRLLSAPLELRAPPPVDRRSGGLRPGFLEDYPNGGGARAYLIRVGRDSGATTLFWSDTGNPAAWETPLRADTAFLRAAGVDLSNLRAAGFPRPTRDLLAAALREEGLRGVDAWIGFPGDAHVRQVVPTLRPRAFIPHHWDDFWTPMRHGVGQPFDDSAIRPYLDSAGVSLVAPVAYYQRLRPVAWRRPGTYQAGVDAGIAAAGELRGADVLRFAAGAGGGFVAGATALFLPFGSGMAAAGLSLVIVVAETGSLQPPVDLAARAHEAGPDFAAGFNDGFARQRRTDRRTTTWIGAGLGAVAGLAWLYVLFSGGYT